MFRMSNLQENYCQGQKAHESNLKTRKVPLVQNWGSVVDEIRENYIFQLKKHFSIFCI